MFYLLYLTYATYKLTDIFFHIFAQSAGFHGAAGFVMGGVVIGQAAWIRWVGWD